MLRYIRICTTCFSEWYFIRTRTRRMFGYDDIVRRGTAAIRKHLPVQQGDSKRVFVKFERSSFDNTAAKTV